MQTQIKPGKVAQFQTRKVVAPRQRQDIKSQAFLGSPTNLIMMGTTMASLIGGRFGILAGTRYFMDEKLKMRRQECTISTGDPDGYNYVDVLAHGSFGHIIGVGSVLGLKALEIIP